MKDFVSPAILWPASISLAVRIMKLRASGRRDNRMGLRPPLADSLFIGESDKSSRNKGPAASDLRLRTLKTNPESALKQFGRDAVSFLNLVSFLSAEHDSHCPIRGHDLQSQSAVQVFYFRISAPINGQLVPYLEPIFSTNRNLDKRPAVSFQKM